MRIESQPPFATQPQFIHAADFQARIVIQNALFAVGPFGKKKASDLIIPWATYTSPEIAHVGMYSNDAKEAGVEIDTYVQQLEHVDQAILEGTDEGFVKIHTKIPESKLGKMAVNFDLVLGITPDENAPINGGIAKPKRR